MDQVALRKKLENFWYYYKWHTLGGLFLIATALVAIHSCRMRVNPDLYLLYMRDETPIASQTAELETWLGAMVEDINEDGEKTVRVMSYSRSNMWNGDDSAAMVVQVNAGDAVLYLVSGRILPSSKRMWMALMGDSKDSMIFSEMGSSRSRWMVRRRFLAP